MSFIIAIDAAGNVVGQGVNDGQFIPVRPGGGEIRLVDELPVDYLLAQTKTAQIMAVYRLCESATVSGYTSNALGAAYTYPSNRDDQINLIGAVASGLPVIYFWCADGSGLWDRRAHTADQIKQVLADAGVQRMAYSAKLAGLVGQITIATTPAAVNAVSW